jgi:hypothetical protein
MFMKNKMKILIKTAMMLSVVLVSGCMPDDITDNGLYESNLDATFTVIPDESSPNYFTLSSNANNYITSRWDLGDGAPAFTGDQQQRVFLPDAGTYTITHMAVGKGGATKTETGSLTVTTSDPNSGNIVVGGKLDTPDDISKWTVLNISASGAAWTFAGGKATVTGSGYNQQGFYQTINVIKNKTYKIELIASSTTGVFNTWFEVYCSTTAPTQNNDYSAGGALRNINTWDGCGSSPFSGKISVVGCNASKNTGTFTPTADGVMYLVIKGGGEDLKGGISIDNIEVRAQ